MLYHPYVDYVQSTNTLFHFMKKFGYLKTILLKRAIVPRYCIETVDYLRIQHAGTEFPKIAVLQKCFCDIPFHKLADTFSVTGTGDAYKELSAEEKFRVEHNNTHFDFYGGFAIGFSKSWSEQNRLTLFKPSWIAYKLMPNGAAYNMWLRLIYCSSKI